MIFLVGAHVVVYRQQFDFEYQWETERVNKRAKEMQEKQIEKQSPIRICIGQKIDEQIWEMSDTYVFVDWKYDVYKMYAYFTNLFAIE